ncbi:MULTISPECIES: hypothetical protein [Vibrio]|uniref:hypothetical protein n=1 Tax=Vibrio TaxID=662 RepID=UPI000C8654F5|nr:MULTISPECIES: hypothetical protein [Vibrio]ELY1990400.1 hypothetical protein [Vibrio harveyi]MDA0126030.1 hypothetical protein [Vibrio sp. MM46]PMO35292.1 hypothetical protein BCT11_22955 [Vibrio sp. 10N.222.52.B12]HDM8193520.1 hypothetical protein [Vibrio harveyi]
MYLGFAILCFLYVSATSVVIYENYAEPRGWSVGAWFSGLTILVLASLITAFACLILSYTLYVWWTPILLFLIGSSLAQSFIASLKVKSQAFAFVGLILGWGLLYGVVL